MLVCGCASHVAPSNANVLALPAHPPTTTSSSRPLPIEPSAGEPDACELEGDSLPTDVPLDLCGAPEERACFGRLTESDGVVVRHLAVAPSLAAHLVYERNGVIVSAVIDGHKIEPHFAKPRLLSEFFVPAFATMSITRASAEDASVAVDPGEDVVPALAITARVACSEITSDAVPVELADVEALAHLGKPLESASVHAATTFTLRTSPKGPVVARVEGGDHEAVVYRRAERRALVVLHLSEGWAVGWLDESLVSTPAIGFHRVKAPSIRMGITQRGVVCPHAVNVAVDVAGTEVRAVTVEAGTAFDPSDVPAILGMAALQLRNGATARVREVDVADCGAP